MRPQQYKNGDCCSGVVVATMARTANGWGSATERSVRQRRRPRRHDLGFMAGLVALLVATVVAATGLMGAGASRVFVRRENNVQSCRNREGKKLVFAVSKGKFANRSGEK
uniref:(northern house mosquito) hypothetical protein n=1 Tax=Culex pipiens TaxID=7175 RepID=A0A8D8HYI7_CULPI